jgi:hypothetical protein
MDIVIITAALLGFLEEFDVDSVKPNFRERQDNGSSEAITWRGQKVPFEKEEEILHIGAKGGRGEREREIGTIHTACYSYVI